VTATTKFAHVVLQTRSVEQMRDWYCTVPDAHVVNEGTTCASSPSMRNMTESRATAPQWGFFGWASLCADCMARRRESY
jgi:hypothetical protein